MAEAQTAQRNGRPFRHLGVRSFNDENHIFHLQSESGESRLGMCFQGLPLTGADDRALGQIKSTLSSGFPADTIVQFGLFSEPDISATLTHYVATKKTRQNILQALYMRRADFLKGGVDTPLIGMNDVHLCRQRIIVSITIPCAEIPTEDQIIKMEEIGSRLKDGLNSANLSLEPMDEGSYLSLLRRFFHMYSHDDYECDEFTPIREQVFSPSDSFEDCDTHLKFNEGEGEYYAKIISVKHLPRKANIGFMNVLIGDPFGSRNQVTVPYFMSATMIFPDQRKKAASIRSKHIFVTNQCVGPVSNFIPRLRAKKAGMDVMLHEMEVGGSVICELNFSMTMFSRNLNALHGASAAFCAWAGSYQFELREDRRILKPLFHTILPMNAIKIGYENLYRFNTLAVNHAIRLLPIIGEWTGSGLGASSIMTTRRGTTALFDPYDSSTNYNGFVVAESGAGKSFLLQQLLTDWMGQGARAWVIDQGRSYEKLCKALNGQFIEFSEKSKICLNPFTHIKNIDEDMDILKSIIAKMAAPNHGLDDFRLSALEAKIKAAFDDKAHKATITDVAEQCLNDNDSRIRDIGTQLYPFTRRGSYGTWFNGDNNIDLTNDFVVLELQDLASMPVLQQVILIQLFAHIASEMYFTEGRKKILLVDEAKQLIDDPVIGKALDASYQKIRKHEGSAWMAVQNIAYLINSANGQSMMGNSAWKIILKQNSDAIEQAVRSGSMKFDPYQESILKSITTVPGKYAEMMIRNDNNWGVVRLVTDRFSQILFSTKGWERDEVFKRMRDGEDVVEIIEQCIKEGR